MSTTPQGPPDPDASSDGSGDGFPFDRAPRPPHPEQGRPQAMQGRPPQGQPQQNHPHQNPPPQGYPSQGPPPQQGYGPGGYGPGGPDPRQQYAPSGPPGWNPQQGPGGPPPRKSKTSLIVAIVAIVGALAMGGVLVGVLTGNEKTVTTPSPSVQLTPSTGGEPQTEPPSDPPTAPSDPTTPVDPPKASDDPNAPIPTDLTQLDPPGDAPSFPSTVGDYAMQDGASQGDALSIIYVAPDGKAVVATFFAEFYQASFDRLQDRTTLGAWECGKSDVANTCMTKNWGGQTSIVGVPEASSADLAEFGDQLLAQWK